MNTDELRAAYADAVATANRAADALQSAREAVVTSTVMVLVLEEDLAGAQRDADEAYRDIQAQGGSL